MDFLEYIVQPTNIKKGGADLKNLDNNRCSGVHLTIDIVVSLPHTIPEKRNRAS